MDFAWNPQQRELRDLTRRILSERVTAERLTGLERAGGAVFDADLWAELATAGVVGAALPEAYGGGGAGPLELLPVLEEAGAHVAPVPLVPTVVLGAMTLVADGTEQQRAVWLPGVAAGRVLLTAAVDEPGGDDPAAPRTRATRVADGWQLTGEKRSVPYGAQADRVLVPATTDDGVLLLLVDPAGDGVVVTAQVATNRQPVAALDLAGTIVSDGDVVAGVARGAAATRAMVERGAAAWCAVQSGVCRAALRAVSRHTAERQQFGKPIGEFQAVAQRAADAFIDAEMVQLTARQANFRVAQGWPATAEVHTAKFWAGDGAMRVVHAAMHLHGGLGVSTAHPLHRYFLWAKQLEHSLGTPTRELVRLGRILADEPV